MSERSRGNPISTGASAARVLARACERELRTGDSPKPGKLEVVRDLARSLEDRLEGLARVAARSESPEHFAEAAQRCGDLATLASCNAEDFDSPRSPAETISLASRAVQDIRESLEDSAGDLISRDLRSGSWKVSLAARQLEESYGDP